MATGDDAAIFVDYPLAGFILTPSAGGSSKFALLWQQHQDEQEFKAAITAVMDALLETRRYLVSHRESRSASKTSEDISDLWKVAGTKIRAYDQEFSDNCLYKAEGWADESLWTTPKFQGLHLKLDEMADQLRKIRQPARINTWAQLMEAHFPAYVGIFFIIVTIVLAFTFSSPTALQTHIILAVLSLGGGAFASEISGMIKVDLSLTQKFVIGATGAAAVFVILYFAVPAGGK
jgi:hypothetical protein